MDQLYNPLRHSAHRQHVVGVLTVDDHPLFRQGIRHLLLGESGIEPRGEVSSIEEALEWLGKNQAEVVLLDHDLPGTRGVDGLPRLLEAHKDVQVIVLTVCDDDDVFLRAIRSGACGYMLKDAAPDRLVEAIRAAAAGECRVSGRMVRTLFQRVGRKDNPGCPDCPRNGGNGATGRADRLVTVRERQILAHLVQGRSNKEIARELGLSPNTIRNQLQRLQERFQARNRVQLALFARDRGFD